MIDRRNFIYSLSSLGLILGSPHIAKSALDSSDLPLAAKPTSSTTTNLSIGDLEDVTVTTPRNGQLLRFQNNVWTNVSDTHLRLEDFGGIADGVTDNSAAVQSALDALKTAHGGTLVFPDGVTKIAGSSYVDFQGKQGAIRFVGSGSNSVVHIATGTDIAFGISNNSQLTVENLTFIGTQEFTTLLLDTTQSVFMCSYVEQVTFRDCKFLGIGIDAPYDDPSNSYALNINHGIISVNEGDLLVERCYFGGCFASQCSCVNVSNWNSLTVRDSQFIDYGYYNGDLMTKTGYGTSAAWIRALYQNPLTEARSKGKVTIERTSFDEGTNVSILVFGATWVDINNISVNNGVSTSIVLYDVSHTTIKDSFVGYINNDTALSAFTCKTIEVENLILGGNVKYLRLETGYPKLSVKHSTLPGGSLAANGVINNSQGKVEIQGY